MKTIIKTAIFALSLVAGASASQAQPGYPVWNFPYKGTTYASQAAPVQHADSVQQVRYAKHAAGHARTASKGQVIR